MIEGSIDDMHVRIAPALPVVDRELLSRAVKDATGSAQGRHGEDAHWAFRGTFAAPDGTLLEETICTDAGYEQKFYIKVVNRPECTLVKLDGVFLPFLTPAVRFAMQDLAKKLQDVQ